MYYTITNGHTMLTVSSYGGEILSLLDFDANKREYIWRGDEKYWDGHAPNLFPIVGRVKGGKYTYKDKKYEITSPHGFVWVSELNTFDHTDNSFTMGLSTNAETLKAYPFEFDYKVKFLLEGKKLTVSYVVTNPSPDETMIFALGAHPGFSIPLNDGEKFEDYYIEFDEPCEPDQLICEKAFLTGKTEKYDLVDGKILPLRHNLFDNDAIMLQNHSKKLSIRSKTGKNGVTVTYPDFKYLGIWHTNETDAPFVCIEPWNGVPSLIDAEEKLETKYDMMQLEPGGVYKASYTVEIF